MRQSTRTIKYAYIVFRQTKAKEKAMSLYSVSMADRFLTNLCGCCCSKRMEKYLKRYFEGEWLEVSAAGLPDQILWQNIGVSSFSRRIRKVVNWLVAIALIIIGIFGVVYFKYKSDVLKEEFQTEISCPDSITK